MLSEMKKKQNNKKPFKRKSGKINDYGNDPFFVKKGEESRSFLEKRGFPKELLTRK